MAAFLDNLTHIWCAFVDVLDQHAGAITAIATVVIAAFTIALAWSTKKLWNSAEKQAGISNRTLNHMEDTARKELRAYVAVEHIWFPPVIRMAGGQEARVNYSSYLQLKIKNYGKTPCFNTSIFCANSTNEPSIFTIVEPEPLVGKQMLHPDMGYQLGIASPNWTQIFWVWGHFIYQDNYDRWWRTNFCYAHQPPQSMAPLGDDLFTPYSMHNNEKGPFDSEADAIKCTEI